MLTRLRDRYRAGLAASNVEQQRNGPLCGALLLCWIDAPLVALTRVRQHAPATCAAYDGFRRKVSHGGGRGGGGGAGGRAGAARGAGGPGRARAGGERGSGGRRSEGPA